MKWCTKFPKPNLTCFHTTSACWTTSLFDVLKVNWLKIWPNVEFSSNQGCYTPWGSGGWRSWFPGRRRWRWRSCGDQRWGRWWPPSPPPPPPWQLARSPENLACMRKFISVTKDHTFGVVCTLFVKAGCTFVGHDKCELYWSKVNHWCSILLSPLSSINIYDWSVYSEFWTRFKLNHDECAKLQSKACPFTRHI